MKVAGVPAALEVGGLQAELHPLLPSSNHGSSAGLGLPRGRHHRGQGQLWPRTPCLVSNKENTVIS